MISDFFLVHIVYGIDVKDVWLQQNDATYHTTHATIDLMRQTFYGCLIRWLPRQFSEN